MGLALKTFSSPLGIFPARSAFHPGYASSLWMKYKFHPGVTNRKMHGVKGLALLLSSFAGCFAECSDCEDKLIT